MIFFVQIFKSKTRKVALIALALIIILLSLVWGRLFYCSSCAFQDGEIHLRANLQLKAISSFGDSIRCYTPFNPNVRKSAEQLWNISQKAQKSGDISLALLAAETLRNGFIAARSLYTPGIDWIENCDRRISELLKCSKTERWNRREEKREIQFTLENTQIKSPNIWWSIILLTGFLGWIGVVIAFVTIGVRDFLSIAGFLRFSFLKWVMLWAAFFTLWIIGMIKA